MVTEGQRAQSGLGETEEIEETEELEDPDEKNSRGSNQYR